MSPDDVPVARDGGGHLQGTNPSTEQDIALNQEALDQDEGVTPDHCSKGDSKAFAEDDTGDDPNRETRNESVRGADERVHDTVTFRSKRYNYRYLRKVQGVDCTPHGYTVEDIQNTSLPPNFIGSLMPHQEAGRQWLLKPPYKKILADDFGLGKTRTAIAYICSLLPMSGNEGRGALVVAPKTLIKEWEVEITKVVDLNVIRLLIVESPAHLDHKSLKEVRRFDIILTTPHMIHRQMLSYEKSIATCKHPQPLYGWPLVGAALDTPKGELNRWQCIILDEGHLIRNNGKMALSLRKIQALHHLTLTGAPVQNTSDDLSSLLEFVNGPIALLRSESRSLAELRTRATDLFALHSSSLLRRTRRTLINGNPIVEPRKKTVFHHHVEFSRLERRVYHHVLSSLQRDWILVGKKQWLSNLGNIQLSDTSKLIRLRQACCDPHILPLKPKISKQTSGSGPPKKRLKGHDGLPKRKVSSLHALRRCLSNIPPEQPPSKVLAMIRLMLEAREKDSSCRFLVFSEFRSMLQRTQTHLQRAGLHFVMCDGSMGFVRKSMSEIALKGPDKCDGMLSTLASGGLGLSLLEATVVFFLNPVWTPARHRQAEARVFQMTQTRDVTVHYLLIDKRKTYRPGNPIEPTMEALVMDIQRRKTEREYWAYRNPPIVEWLRWQATQASDLTEEDLNRIFGGQDHDFDPVFPDDEDAADVTDSGEEEEEEDPWGNDQDDAAEV